MTTLCAVVEQKTCSGLRESVCLDSSIIGSQLLASSSLESATVGWLWHVRGAAASTLNTVHAGPRAESSKNPVVTQASHSVWQVRSAPLNRQHPAHTEQPPQRGSCTSVSSLRPSRQPPVDPGSLASQPHMLRNGLLRPRRPDLDSHAGPDCAQGPIFRPSPKADFVHRPRSWDSHTALLVEAVTA